MVGTTETEAASEQSQPNEIAGWTVGRITQRPIDCERIVNGEYGWALAVYDAHTSLLYVIDDLLNGAVTIKDAGVQQAQTMVREIRKALNSQQKPHARWIDSWQKLTDAFAKAARLSRNPRPSDTLRNNTANEISVCLSPEMPGGWQAEGAPTSRLKYVDTSRNGSPGSIAA